MLLYKNINYLLRQRGALPLSAEAFLRTDPDNLWEIVSELNQPFEHLNTVDFEVRDRLLSETDIKLAVLDVDGVFTDGGMYYTSSGEEMKKFNVKDGMAVTRALKSGLEVGIISAASRSEAVELRAEILGIRRVYVGKKPKIEVLESWLYETGLGYENVSYIGDDVNDTELLRKCGLTAAPADAAAEAKRAADVVLRAKGGRGCIREFFDTYLFPDLSRDTEE